MIFADKFLSTRVKQLNLLTKYFTRKSISRQARIFTPVIINKNLQVKWWKLKKTDLARTRKQSQMLCGDGCLSSWRLNDNFHLEHAKWYLHWEYILQKKGFEFVFWLHFQVSEPLSATLTRPGTSHSCQTSAEKVRFVWKCYRHYNSMSNNVSVFTEAPHHRTVVRNRIIAVPVRWLFQCEICFDQRNKCCCLTICAPSCIVPSNVNNALFVVCPFWR